MILSWLLLLVCLTASAAHTYIGIPDKNSLEIPHRGYTAGYSKAYGQPLWVLYRLDCTQPPRYPRISQFSPDPKAPDITPDDYRGIPYDRGHMAPAQDMGYTVETLKDSFLMTNICPQTPGFNRGVWKRLEQWVRQQVRNRGVVYVVSGPLFIGPVHIRPLTAPTHFYKVLYSPGIPPVMYGFIVPHRSSREPLWMFSCTVDTLEKITGFNFFSNLPMPMQERLESLLRRPL